MILLFCISDFNVGQHNDTRGEVEGGVRVDAPHLFEHVPLLARQLLEVVSNRVETIVDIVHVCISS